MSNPKIMDDRRIDPSIKAILGAMVLPPAVDVATHLLAFGLWRGLSLPYRGQIVDSIDKALPLGLTDVT